MSVCMSLRLSVCMKVSIFLNDENLLIQCTQRHEILYTASLMLKYIIPDIQSHLDSIQESRTASKTPWRILWRQKRNILFQCTQRPKTLHTASFMLIYVLPDVQSHLDSIQESRMSSQTPWRMLRRHKKKVLFQGTQIPDILHTASLMQKYTKLYLTD